MKSNIAPNIKNEEQNRIQHLPLNSVLDFMRLLWGLDHVLQSRSKQMFRQINVTGPQRLLIRIVGLFPGISAREIACNMQLHPSTISIILKKLEAMHYIKREADRADKRRAHFYLTRMGQQIDKLRTGTVESSISRAMQKLPQHKINATIEVLSLLTAELGNSDQG